MDKMKSSGLRQTLFVLIGLLVLTAIEYTIGTRESVTLSLLIISVLKAALILNYFMQISSLWREEEH